MKTILKYTSLMLVMIVVNIATVLVVIDTLPLTQAGTTTCIDGDHNGDGQLDIADPIVLLNYLFSDGEVPVACAHGATPTFSLGLDETDGSFNGAVVFDIEYNDPFDLHDEDASTITLTAGTWLIGFDNFEAFGLAGPIDLLVDGELHKSFSTNFDQNEGMSTILALSETSDVEVVSDGQMEVFGEGDTQERKFEFWGVRVSE